MTALDYTARVAAGAAFLDERMPGWAEWIDLDSLSLMDDCDCVLGQLSGYYRDGVAQFGLRLSEEVSLGFMPGEGSAWDLLDAAWTAEIRKRREDNDWAGEWDSADSNAYQDRVEAEAAAEAKR
jgi:hypothetical protein